MASLATAQSERASIEAFRRDVLEASLTRLVLVDFWAEWCGPCKTLGPLLAKVVASYAGRAALVKIDVDKNPGIAQQFRIQSIPTVYAFLGGQPVDGFAGALAERELRAFIDRLLANLPPAEEALDLAALIDAARERLEAGEAMEALAAFEALAAEVPEDLAIAAGRARALLALGRLDAAEALLAALPATAAREPAVAQARAALALARAAPASGELATLAAAAAAAPEDMEAALALAGAQMAAGARDDAADTLLAMIARDREWNEGAARARLLQLFEAVGLADPWVKAQRRRLAAILFA